MSDASDNIDFSWGSKNGRSGLHRDVQLYESFTYDGVEYFLYDSVYAYKDDEPKPYIGKLIEIYELPCKARKVKLLWFFYPLEISNYLGGANVLQNEIFLAAGCGKGLMTVNPLGGSRWMTPSSVPWEERMKEAYDRGTLVLLQNLDPSYTSREVESIVWHGLGCDCTGKFLPHTAISTPHSGQAFAIFKNSEAANKIVRLLNEECLMLPNGRPLVGSIGVLCLPGEQSSFHGHLTIDKLRRQMLRDLKEAVSTSHFSQPNNLEYDLALNWCVLQKRSNYWWQNLHKEQREDIEKLTTKLKPK